MDERSIITLQTSLAGVCGHVNTQHAQLVRLTETALSERAWAQIDVHSPTHWLAWQAGLSEGTARKIVSIARGAADHPSVMAAFDAGELSLDQVALAIKAPGYTDAEICNLAKVLTVIQLSRVVRRYPFTPDPNTEPASPDGTPADPGEVASSLSIGVDDNGVGQLRGTLAADDYRVFEAAMREARDSLFHHGNPDVSWADALVEIANRSLGTVTEGTRRDRFRINLHVHTDRSVTFGDNWRVPDSLRDLLCCDATLTPIYLDHDGIPVGVGRSQHIVPDRTRRLVEHRDLGCRVPGCCQTRWVQVHHIIHFGPPDRGPTETWNLLCLCPRHHRLHHKGRLGISGNADLPTGTPGAVEFTDQRGQRIKPAADSAVPIGPPPAPSGAYQHPLGERLDYSAGYFNEPQISRRPH